MKNKPLQAAQNLAVIIFERAFFLQGDLGKNFLREYNAKVEKDHKNASALKVLSWDNKEQVVIGSNPFSVVLASQILQPKGIRTATQAELEKILKNNSRPLEGHYEDSALVWRSNEEPNKYLAQDIYAQFKGRGILFKDKTPYVIPLFGLALRNDANSPDDLSFALTEQTTYFKAPILNSKTESRFNSSDIDENTGLPKKVGEAGDVFLYTRNSGLSRLSLDGDLDLGSGGKSFAGSSEYGRIVCIASKAVAPKKVGVRLLDSLLRTRKVKT